MIQPELSYYIHITYEVKSIFIDIAVDVDKALHAFELIPHTCIQYIIYAHHSNLFVPCAAKTLTALDMVRKCGCVDDPKRSNTVALKQFVWDIYTER